MQLQEKIEGYDVRVHVIDRSFVAVKILTEADDYRYAAQQDIAVEYEEVDCPQDLIIRAQEYMRKERLHFAGFDFRVDGDNWVLLECNPMPGFDFYDKVVDGKISARLIDYFKSSQKSEGRDGSVSIDLGLFDGIVIGNDRRPKTNHS